MERGRLVNDQAQKLRRAFRNGGFSPDTREYSPQVKNTGNVRRCKSIAVTSGKGGVGKSNISISLAVALSALNKKVCVVDADLGLANIHIMLGIAPKYNVSHAVNEECGLVDVIAHGPGGIDVLPGASGIEKMANLDPLLLGMLRRKFTELENMYDFLIVDTGAGISRTVTEFAASSDATVVVATPEPASFTDAYAMIKVLYEKKMARLSVLLNMAGNDREGKETFDKLNALVVKFLYKPLEMLGMLPFDRQIPALIRHQKLAVMENPRSLFSLRIRNCARTLCGVAQIKKEGFFARILGV
jgi:flagellar biosynthesis protein FlhG